MEFRDLAALAQDEEAILAHADRHEVRRFTESGEVLINDPHLSEQFRQEVLQSVTRSRRTHLQLLLVYIVAVVERILDDFLIVSFIAHPDWMHDYLRLAAEPEARGVVTLKDVVSTSSKGELIQKLARRATDNANRGTFTDRLKRIEKLSGFSFSGDRVKELKTLADKRNSLVHELRLEAVSEENVEEAFDLTLALLKDLGHAAEKASLPHGDQSGLLGWPGE